MSLLFIVNSGEYRHSWMVKMPGVKDSSVVDPEIGIYSTHSKSKRTLRKREQNEFRSQKTGRRGAIFGKDTAILNMISQQLWLTTLNLHKNKPTNRKSWIKEGTLILVVFNRLHPLGSNKYLRIYDHTETMVKISESQNKQKV